MPTLLAPPAPFLKFQCVYRKNDTMVNQNLQEASMQEYDVIILGSGAGANLIEDALSHGKSVALVDKGPAGGTCLNLG